MPGMTDVTVHLSPELAEYLQEQPDPDRAVALALETQRTRARLRTAIRAARAQMAARTPEQNAAALDWYLGDGR
jgi:hypothetical protein